MSLYGRNQSAGLNKTDSKVEKIVKENGTTKTGSRVINLHDFPEVKDTISYASSGVLLPSGESHFQDFTDKTSSPAVNRSNDSLTHSTDKYELIRKETLVAPSSDAFSAYTESNSFLSPKEFSYVEKDTLSNANETRNSASGLGLYDTPPFNPYIHYLPGSGGVVEIDYSENYKKATKYLDPYADKYIFQTSISEETFQEEGTTIEDSSDASSEGSETDTDSSTGNIAQT